MTSRATAAMSIDIEDWFQVENLKGAVARDTWDARELRVERNTDRILELMESHGVRATFFTLGWVAQRCPALLQRVAAAGHEVACHGFGHDLVYDLEPDLFREDLRRSKSAIEDIVQQPVLGYRAPSFSITDWAIDVLQQEGFEYDSSAFVTVGHDRYGTLTGVTAGTPVVELREGFHEVCVSSLQVAGRSLPWGGGGYFRLMPYRLFRWGVERILASGSPYTFYLHPWEIDPGQPRMKIKPSYAFRHYVNLGRCERRLDSLFGDFQWCTVADQLAAWRG